MSFYLKFPWTRGTKRSDIARAWLSIAETQAGMLVIHDLVNRYHVLTPHAGDALSEGQRSVVLYALAQANITNEDMTQIKASEIEPPEEE